MEDVTSETIPRGEQRWVGTRQYDSRHGSSPCHPPGEKPANLLLCRWLLNILLWFWVVRKFCGLWELRVVLGTAWLYMVAPVIGQLASHRISLVCVCFGNKVSLLLWKGPLLATSHIFPSQFPPTQPPHQTQPYYLWHNAPNTIAPVYTAFVWVTKGVYCMQVCGMDPNTDTHKVVENGNGTSGETVPDQPAPDLSILLKKLEDQNRYHS